MPALDHHTALVVPKSDCFARRVKNPATTTCFRCGGTTSDTGHLPGRQRRRGCHRQSNQSVDDCQVLRELSTTPPSGHLTSVETPLRGRFTSPVPAVAFQLPFPGGCTTAPSDSAPCTQPPYRSTGRRALSERPITIINITYDSEYAQVANRCDTSRRRPGTRSRHLVRAAQREDCVVSCIAMTFSMAHHDNIDIRSCHAKRCICKK